MYSDIPTRHSGPGSSTSFTSASALPPPLYGYTHDLSTPSSCHPKVACPIYADHFNTEFFAYRHAELRSAEDSNYEREEVFHHDEIGGDSASSPSTNPNPDFEPEAAAREGESVGRVLTGDSEEDTRALYSDWGCQRYDGDSYESSATSSLVSLLSSASLTPYSNVEDVSQSIPASSPPPTSKSYLAVNGPSVHNQPQSPLSTLLPLNPSSPNPIVRGHPPGTKPVIYVDASFTGVGFSFCVPIPSISISTSQPAPAYAGCSHFINAVHASPFTPKPKMNNSFNMTCYWLAWKWVPGHPSIPLGVSKKIVVSWAELVALELGVHTLCAMGYGCSYASFSTSSSPPLSASTSISNRPLTKLTIYSDNTGAVTALSPSRRAWTPKHGLNTIVQRILATCEERGVQIDVRWVRSEENVADGPSKGRGVVECVGVGIFCDSGVNVGLGGIRERERVWEWEREWMKFIDMICVPEHLGAFIQRPTGGIVGLQRIAVGANTVPVPV